jgi:hypothetical protein
VEGVTEILKLMTNRRSPGAEIDHGIARHERRTERHDDFGVNVGAVAVNELMVVLGEMVTEMEDLMKILSKNIEHFGHQGRKY